VGLNQTDTSQTGMAGMTTSQMPGHGGHSAARGAEVPDGMSGTATGSASGTAQLLSDAPDAGHGRRPTSSA